jgi:hypothetical protein
MNLAWASEYFGGAARVSLEELDEQKGGITPVFIHWLMNKIAR